MPQFSIEVSWVELFKLVLWWVTILLSFHVGRVRGKIPEGQKESKVDEVTDVSPQMYEVPQAFMARKGLVLHSTKTCSYLNELDLVAMSWCASCKKVFAKRSNIA